jgi:hypothetical protein
MRALLALAALLLAPLAAAAQPVPPTPAGQPSAAEMLAGTACTNLAISMNQVDQLRAQLADAQRQLAEARAAKPETKP